MTTVVNSYTYYYNICHGIEDEIDHSKDVYIGRGSKWGNPFKIGPDGSREEVIEKYRTYFKSRNDLRSALDELDGKNLVCFCRPAKCHGDILLEELNEWKLWRKNALSDARDELERVTRINPVIRFDLRSDDQDRSVNKLVSDVASKHGVGIEELLTYYKMNKK